MWDFLTKKCGIFGIEGGTKLWDFQHRGGDFRPLTSGHTGYSNFGSSVKSQHCIWREFKIGKKLEPSCHNSSSKMNYKPL